MFFKRKKEREAAHTEMKTAEKAAKTTEQRTNELLAEFLDDFKKKTKTQGVRHV